MLSSQSLDQMNTGSGEYPPLRLLPAFLSSESSSLALSPEKVLDRHCPVTWTLRLGSWVELQDNVLRVTEDCPSKASL